MTQVNAEKIKCHICGAEYIGGVVYSWNEEISGPFPKDKYAVSCPKCKAPYKDKINPNIGASKDILMKMISSPEAAADLLFQLSQTEEDVDKWGNIMSEMDYEKWKKDQLEFGFNVEDMPKESADRFVENDRRRDELIKLKQAGQIQILIDKVISMAKEKIITEKNSFLVS